jgi:hypothetical protein
MMPGMRRLLLPALVMAAFPASAAAQVDDRAAARAFADTALRAQAEIAVASLERASHELHAVQTTDAVLRSGRTGWRRMRRMRRTYAGIAELPRASVCAQLRAYVRTGYRHTGETRRAMRAFRAMTAWDTRDVDRRMAAAVERLIELGVPAAEADAFDGELGE